MSVVKRLALLALALLLSAGSAHACGWYVMFAPWSNATNDLDVGAPISKWHEFEAFDTAAACEKRKLSEGKWWLDHQSEKVEATGGAKMQEALWANAKCVAVDDPQRLAR